MAEAIAVVQSEARKGASAVPGRKSSRNATALGCNTPRLMTRRRADMRSRITSRMQAALAIAPVPVPAS
eukprot:CAMPEP_0196789828 /NCGR_PEP_ID=MMETSP1104-20130614/27219_1 /TAXON_ID=33652 /ORGANISM="Cafeteria sp., Strain Caron Lab Isolate" /LENGTH=68 /DNA_ID=CAMNT_0042160191 /DNA_START=42 /DNA_END=245 /DNA_ORIENTATION=+